jgi:hypothetical protein
MFQRCTYVISTIFICAHQAYVTVYERKISKFYGNMVNTSKREFCLCQIYKNYFTKNVCEICESTD